MTHYGDLPGALAYHEARANAAWTAAGVTDTQRTAALVRASVWLDGEYGAQFPGKKTGGRSQQRAWPRTGGTDAEGEELPDDEVPFEVTHSTYEAALRELSAPGSLSPDFVAAERIKQEQVGDLSTTYMDGSGTAADVKPVVNIIDGLLSGLLAVASSSSTSLVGFLARA
ncbi:hypothetical protein APY04_0828 [Hyphomicrobium sulfonivorans]|uniref:Putative DnaT-like domain-containing protein n=1 Tax=Hyphomicrobium sulfonivorans TaxID=121290 RepID=A0A120CXC6_HYPSL|nr:DnaT-like ssDNA-binding protein [Hyphomicrobium sulfonivorans]KWT70767.1 hypothetical protein APY04_0828 [Hyphomicrobium sulfonivorans]